MENVSVKKTPKWKQRKTSSFLINRFVKRCTWNESACLVEMGVTAAVRGPALFSLSLCQLCVSRIRLTAHTAGKGGAHIFA